MRRFESSRAAPLQGGVNFGSINRERALLGDLRTRADDVIDTTNCSVHDLSRQIRDLVATESDLALKINVMSFGFKYGIPLDADYVCDVRFYS